VNFWEWLVDQGLIAGDPTYYSEQRAQPGEYEHAVRTAINALDDTNRAEFYSRLVDVGAIEGDPTYYSDLLAQPEEVENAIVVAATAFRGGLEAGEDEASSEPDPALGVWGGGETIKVTADGQERFYQIYEFPAGSGNFVSYQYNDFQQVKDVFGSAPAFTVRTETWFNQFVLAEAPAEEVIGRAGTFQGYTEELMRDAATAAGVRDPSLAGRIASDPEMQDIMAQAIAGGWTQAQILAEQRNTSFWKDVLYPGIEQFYGKTADPEGAWVDYRANVEPALRQLGYLPNAAGTFDDQIKTMLDLGIDAQTFLTQVPTFIQAQQNSEFASILDQWAERDLGRTIDFNDWFDLVAGESIPELEAVAEKAQLAWTAQNAQVGITDLQIEDLAGRTQLSQAQAAQTFANMSRTLLALDPEKLARGNLTRDDLLSTFAGADPTSGRSIEEVKLLVSKLVREQDLFDEEKLQFFVGFTPAGTPERPGLRSLAPESA